MSYPENRQTIPNVYNYAGNVDRNTYIAPTQPIPPQPINQYRTSNVQQVNMQRPSPVQPLITSEPVPVTNQRTSQFKGSRTQQVTSTDKRYNSYQHINEYKYNLFSLVDEPWNRCLQIGKCGSCPGNQCIVKQSRRGLWNWD